MKRLFVTLVSLVFVIGGFSLASNYTTEQKNAYNYAYGKGITTVSSIEKANMNGSLTRIAMAKMISNFAINVLGLQPNTSINCSFSDVSSSLDSQYDYGVTQACQLGLMGIGNNGKKSNNFNPYETVTRAQFATAFSRALSSVNGDTVGEGQPYYKWHLQYLKGKGIIKDVNSPTPYSIEKRGNVMVMMSRYGNGSNDGNVTSPSKNGRYVEYYDNGRIWKISNYKNGKLDGEYIEYFKDGSIASKGSYKNGELDGYAVRYCDKGKEDQGYYRDGKCIRWEGTYENGEYIVGGTYKTYYDNGQLQTIENRNRDAELDGEFISYYENGNIKEKGQYKNNKKTGEWVEYFEDGSMASKGSYKDGELDGYWIRYCEKGDTQCTSLDGNYKNGKQIYGVEEYGTFNAYAYWSNGKIQSASFGDENGILNGDYVSFYENGQLKEKGQYKDNKKTGEWIEYFEDGSIASKGSYKNGELDGYAVRYCDKGKEDQGYYRDGKCIRWEGTYENGEYIVGGTYKTYYDNGQLQTIENRNRDAELDGEFISYYENGNIKEKGQYKNNKKTGEWVEYFEDGSMASKGSYKDGELDGYWIRYCEKGDTNCISLDGNYKNGEKIWD